MARAIRIEYENAFYHVTSRGNERKKIFFSKSDYEKFKAYLKAGQDKYDYLLHGYVLMSKHYHLLIETPNANLSKLMHFINGSYTTYVNRRKGRSGHLFQGRYKAVLVDRDSYLLELSRYIHLNPVRAKMTDKPEDYPYSSYRLYIAKKEENIVYRDLILGMMSKNKKTAQKRYRELVESGIDEDIENPLKDLYGGAILGGKMFIKEILNRLKEDIPEKNDISFKLELSSAVAGEKILDMVIKYYGVSFEDLRIRKGDPRNMAIFLLKTYTALSNRQLGEMFGGLGISSVSKAYERFKEKLKKNKVLKNQLRYFSKSLSIVKG